VGHDPGVSSEAVGRTRICVVGAGAVGGVIGTRLASAGHRVSALARGKTLASLRGHGWRLEAAGEVVTAPATASDDAAALGRQDVVVIAVKAHALPALAPQLEPLVGDETIVIPAMNGVPWWFFDGLGGPVDGLRLEAVDPGGVIAKAIPTSRVIGCVVHLSASTSAPGLAVQHRGNRLIVGEPRGGVTSRLRETAALLAGASFSVETSERVQDDIWYKLWGNMTMNPISALTGATADRILDDELVRAFAKSVMAEAAAIGERIGCPIDQSAEDRIAVTRKLGAFKTSMLQDVESARPVELDALVTVVKEIGQAVGIPTPGTDALLGLTRLAARSRGLYP
jgi:2-dehydropantoate 2-reductase